MMRLPMQAQKRVCLVLTFLTFIIALLSFSSMHSDVNVRTYQQGVLQPFFRVFDSEATRGSVEGSTQVLILTYMRSGSSLTGDIMQHSPGAFYLFEPLRSIGHKNKSTATITYVNGTIKPPPFQFVPDSVDILYHWFTCDTTKLPTMVISDGFMNKGIKSRMMKVCMSNAAAAHSTNKTSNQYMCARQLQAICESSPFRIIKTIRLELGDVKHLLSMLPNLKIIHLVRDPRATLASQSRLGMCGKMKGGREGCTHRFCKRLENDLLTEERLLVDYPDRILPVFYSQIAKHPIEATRRMYDFIGADFTASAQEYVFNITMAGHENNCVICTTRSNSSEHVDEWKTRLDRSFIDIIQERCNYILRRYNFEIV